MFVYSCNTQNNIFYNPIIELYSFKVANNDLRLHLWKQHHDTSSQLKLTVKLTLKLTTIVLLILYYSMHHHGCFWLE